MTALGATMIESAGLVRTITEARFVASVARSTAMAQDTSFSPLPMTQEDWVVGHG